MTKLRALGMSLSISSVAFLSSCSSDAPKLEQRSNAAAASGEVAQSKKASSVSSGTATETQTAKSDETKTATSKSDASEKSPSESATPTQEFSLAVRNLPKAVIKAGSLARLEIEAKGYKKFRYKYYNLSIAPQTKDTMGNVVPPGTQLAPEVWYEHTYAWYPTIDCDTYNPTSSEKVSATLETSDSFISLEQFKAKRSYVEPVSVCIWGMKDDGTVSSPLLVKWIEDEELNGRLIGSPSSMEPLISNRLTDNDSKVTHKIGIYLSNFQFEFPFKAKYSLRDGCPANLPREVSFGYTPAAPISYGIIAERIDPRDNPLASCQVYFEMEYNGVKKPMNIQMAGNPL